MKERPILFSGAMVRALLAGTKTQTRRIMKPQPHEDRLFSGGWAFTSKRDGSTTSVCHPLIAMQCPYGEPGDRLWVRESFRPIYPQQASYNGGNPIGYDHREGYQLGYRLGDSINPPKWKPSIHMPRNACRIVLEIVSVRVERLQDISESDAIAEGIERIGSEYLKAGHTIFAEGPNFYTVPVDGGNINRPTAIEVYSALWEWINGPGSWDANPWVWVIEFKRIESAKGDE